MCTNESHSEMALCSLHYTVVGYLQFFGRISCPKLYPQK